MHHIGPSLRFSETSSGVLLLWHTFKSLHDLSNPVTATTQHAADSFAPNGQLEGTKVTVHAQSCQQDHLLFKDLVPRSSQVMSRRVTKPYHVFDG